MEESKDFASDSPLIPKQEELVAELAVAEVKRIDEALLSNTDKQWRKVARVVAAAMTDVECRVVGIPDIYYASRIVYLVEQGPLEFRGELSSMRFSEYGWLNDVRRKNITIKSTSQLRRRILVPRAGYSSCYTAPTCRLSSKTGVTHHESSWPRPVLSG